MKRVALCVGVDRYHDEDINNLGCASRDAEVTAFTLQQQGFDAVRMTHGVTPQAVYDHLRKVAAHLAPGDVFVFFFAGHGKTHKPHGGKADQLFLLPDANATLLADGNLAAAPGLLSWRTLMTLTDRWPGVQRLFIFDACRLPLQPADPGMRGRAASLAAPVQFEGAGVFRDMRLGRVPGPLMAAVGCTVLNSCSEGQQAEELPNYPGGGHGMFTAALIEELLEAGRAGYALATDALFGQRLHGRMQRLGQQHGAKGAGQQPLLVGDPVPLLLVAAAPSASAPTPAPGALLAELLDNFERQFNAGQLSHPARDCCQYTLGRMEAAGMREATLMVYAQRLQQATPAVPAPVQPPVAVAPPATIWRLAGKAIKSVPTAVVWAGGVLLTAGAGYWAWQANKPGTAAPAPPQLAVLQAAPSAKSPAVAASRYRRLEGVMQVAGCVVCGEMSVIEAGTFDMGSRGTELGRQDNEGPVRTVRVAKFEIGRTEVTQGQWKAVMGSNPSHFGGCGDACPVERVSWDDITGPDGFLAKLSKLTGQKYRLPSEAEWEFAARAGTKTPFWSGYEISTTQANVVAMSLGEWPKGQKQTTVRADAFGANGWGIYNVHGNVWEWVQDCMHWGYTAAPNTGQAWETECTAATYLMRESRTDRPSRVRRGGSWGSPPQLARAATRDGHGPDTRDFATGFRIARTPLTL
jgi:formylglycine-generating enzyme required for sulfatase activity/uncharacterized caspase-like protein